MKTDFKFDICQRVYLDNEDKMNKLSMIPTEGIIVEKTYITSDETYFDNLDDANLWQSWLNLKKYLIKDFHNIDEKHTDIMENVISLYLKI